MKVNRDQKLTNYMQKMMRTIISIQKKLHRTKISARNDGIYSLAAGITGETVVITDHQV